MKRPNIDADTFRGIAMVIFFLAVWLGMSTLINNLHLIK